MPEHGSSPNLDKLRQETGCEWPHLAAAADLSQEGRLEIEGLVQSSPSPLPVDCSLILYGSVARDECTLGSDCDWTLLVDGMAKGEHKASAVDIAEQLAKCTTLGKPGRTGVFGNLVFSHDLIHQIGGQEDTNQITTRRVLLLLESIAAGGEGSRIVRERVVRQLIQRYLESGPSLVSPEGEPRCPRFLLNDVVRYWRTMAVDYVRKNRDRGDEGWALRNVKLRLSRKLMFSSGMLTCFDCLIFPKKSDEDECSLQDMSKRPLFIQEYLLRRINATPLEILASGVTAYAADVAARKHLAISLFDPYNDFIGLLNNTQSRDRLESLPFEKADDDELFQQARKIGQRFQDGLLCLFFKTNDELSKATREYGVF